MYCPPTAIAKSLYSFSGSITITSVPNITDLKTSSLIIYDLPAPAVAKTTEL